MILYITLYLTDSSDVTPRELLARCGLSLMFSGVIEDLCTVTRYCYSVKSERIHLHYSPSLWPAVLCPHWEKALPVCECIYAYAVSIATDANGLSSMVILE